MPIHIKNLKLPEIEAFDFELLKNGLYGMIGRNGIGKSTFFSALSGESSISQGEIESGRVAYLPDVESFDGNLNCGDYFAILKPEEKENAEKYAKILGADKFGKKRIGKFSLGMKELFATVLSFSVDCEILIIDELFSGLDVAVKARVYKELAKVAKEKIVILTSHNLKEIEHFCDKTYLLSEHGVSEVTDFEVAAREIGYMDVFY
ncbi:MAG: AAA family ATPase [Streptococcaceae bacterium]|jgi:ABC-2 type transport system ATP-binding protein|nr:AAA family ATPase [Streptococcaceae bacterium]